MKSKKLLTNRRSLWITNTLGINYMDLFYVLLSAVFIFIIIKIFKNVKWGTIRKDGIRTTLLIVEFFIFIFGIGYLTYNNEINIDKFQIMKYIISIVFPINFCVTYMFLLENVIGKFKAFILSILAILIGLLISIIVSVSMIQIPLIFK